MTQDKAPDSSGVEGDTRSRSRPSGRRADAHSAGLYPEPSAVSATVGDVRDALAEIAGLLHLEERYMAASFCITARNMLSASPPSPPAVWSGEDSLSISQSGYDAPMGASATQSLLDRLTAAAQVHFDLSDAKKGPEWQRKAHAHAWAGLCEAIRIVKGVAS